MAGRWYYADGKRAVGPYTLDELRENVRSLSNWPNVLIWKEGAADWQQALTIADLCPAETKPPPIPIQLGSWITPRIKTWLVIGLYLLVALGAAGIVELNKPFATWRKLLDPLPLSSVLGADIALFLISGLGPLIWWAFRRFRIDRSLAPLCAWLALLCIFAFVTVYGQNLIAKKDFYEISRTSLTGKTRQEFIAGAIQSCRRTQEKDPANIQFGITATQITSYCSCYASALADQLSSEEILFYAKNSKPSATTQRKIEGITPTCIQAAIGKQSASSDAIRQTSTANPFGQFDTTSHALVSAAPRQTTAAPTSNFILIKLPRGIEIALPKGWWLIGRQLNQALETSVEAAMDLSNIGPSEGQKANLIAANSMPRSTYAAVRVDSTIPASASISEVSTLSNLDLRTIQTETRTNLQQLLPVQGGELLEFYGVRLDKISSYPSIVTEYRRAGPQGPVVVQVNQIFTPTQEIGLNLSYRESEAVLWKPIIAKVRNSIAIRN